MCDSPGEYAARATQPHSAGAAPGGLACISMILDRVIGRVTQKAGPEI